MLLQRLQETRNIKENDKSHDEPLVNHEEFLKELSRIIKKLQKEQKYWGVCFLLDDADYLVQQSWGGDSLSYLRYLKNSNNWGINPFLGLVLSGNRELKEYNQGVGSSLFNIADIKNIGTLSSSETEELIRDSCQKFQVKITQKEMNRIIIFLMEWGGCHPYLTQEMLRFIVEYKKTGKDIIEEDFIKSFMEEKSLDEISAWWNKEKHYYGLDKREKIVYQAFLEANQATAEILAATVNLSLNDIECALCVLAGNGIIQQLDYETYKIGSKLFVRWN